MADAVRAFIDRHWASVLGRMEVWRSKSANREDVLCFVRALKKEWEGIPLEEKQIAYLPLEPNFWAALTALEACARGREGVFGPGGKPPPENYESTTAEAFEATYDCMRNRKPLPETGFVGRRHLP